MESVAGKTDTLSGLSRHNLDIYIRECKHCAQTCRTCAEAGARDASKFSSEIDTCLECAKTCESLAKELTFQKQGIRNIRQVQIKACVVTCRFCVRQLEEKAGKFECFSICAQAARRCADVIGVLLPKVSRPSGNGFLTFLRTKDKSSI